MISHIEQQYLFICNRTQQWIGFRVEFVFKTH